MGAALAREPRSVVTTVDGVDHHRLEWGTLGCPVLVVLHGGGAHAGWWSAVAGLLADRWHVVALDMVGHGRSSHLDRYSFTGWVDQVMAVVEEVGGPSPVVVGHSMCGVVAAMVGAAHGDRLGGVVVVDTPLDIPPPESIGHAEQIMAARRYASSAEALTRRFRLLPAQPVVHPSLLAHLAAHAVVEHAEGWTWAFDPALFVGHPPDRPGDVGVVLESARCPATVIVADDSPVVPVEQRDRLTHMAAADPDLELLVEPGHHHLMLDHPCDLADILSRLASAYRR
ncbi:hydrolase, putative [Euzebya pacifica]|uniref:Hydrolase, putative n=1 Tax=Euzebya pacifica TaxID=1608957 RepID=A0A346Y371_9ACTN|nr:hydrolase, putative [Euzebya pacifica]